MQPPKSMLFLIEFNLKLVLDPEIPPVEGHWSWSLELQVEIENMQIKGSS